MEKLDDLKNAIVDRLSEEAKKYAGIAIHSKGQAVDYYTGMKTGMARAAILVNGMLTEEPTVDAEWMLKHGMIPDAVALTLPSIDAVPVVRCKDCEWWVERHPRLGIPWCRQTHLDREADGYCEMWKKREERNEHID